MPGKNACLSLICLLTLTTGFAQKKKFEFLGKPDAIVLDLKIDETREYLAASTNTEVQLWNYKSKTLIRSWAVQSIHSIELQNNFLAGISKSGDLFIWDVENGNELKYTIASSPLLCLAWLDSAWIAIGDDRGVLYKVNSESGKIANSVKLDAPAIALSRGINKTLLVGKQNGLEMYDGLSLVPMKAIQENQGEVSEIHVADSADYFITVSNKRFVNKLRLSSLTGTTVKYSGARVTSADYSTRVKNDFIVAVGKLDGDIEVSTRFGSYTGKANAIINETILIKNNLPSVKLVVATHGGGIQIWNARSMKFRAN